MASHVAILFLLCGPAAVAAVRRTSLGAANPLLRRCGQDGQEEDCCACGAPVIDKCFDEANTPRPCCQLWAVDCKEHEPEFQRGLFQDCNFQPFQRGLIDEYKIKDKCETAECSDVEQAKAELMDKIRRHQKLWFQSGLVDPYNSNSKWMNRCACGEFNEETRQCKVKGKSAEKPCCTKLAKDCRPGDPWPQRFALALKEDQQLKAQGTEVQRLYQSCISNCHKKYAELCLDDLKAAAPGSSISRQEASALWVASQGPPPGPYDRQYELHYRAIEQHRQVEKEERVERLHNNILKGYGQLVILTGFTPGFADRDATQQCCKCETPHSFGEVSLGAAVTSFCSAPRCSSLQSCAAADGSFCSGRTCPDAMR